MWRSHSRLRPNPWRRPRKGGGVTSEVDRRRARHEWTVVVVFLALLLGTSLMVLFLRPDARPALRDDRCLLLDELAQQPSCADAGD